MHNNMLYYTHKLQITIEIMVWQCNKTAKNKTNKRCTYNKLLACKIILESECSEQAISFTKNKQNCI